MNHGKKLLLHGHSIASSVLGGLLGFGFATVLLDSAAGTGGGIVAAALIYALLGKVIDIVLQSASSAVKTDDDEDGEEVFDSALIWVLTLLATVVLVVPVSALLAPNYALHGFLTNAVTVVLVYGADMLVGYASPWGFRYKPTL